MLVEVRFQCDLLPDLRLRCGMTLQEAYNHICDVFDGVSVTWGAGCWNDPKERKQCYDPNITFIIAIDPVREAVAKNIATFLARGQRTVYYVGVSRAVEILPIPNPSMGAIPTTLQIERLDNDPWLGSAPGSDFC